MEITIRPFDPRDAAVIQPLFPAEWRFDFGTFVRRHSPMDYFHGRTLAVDGKIAGYGNLFIFDYIAWLGNIVVSPDHRNQGLGTEFTRLLIEIGRELKVKTFYLVATELGEPIYRRLGFAVQGEYVFFASIPEPVLFTDPPVLRLARPEDHSDILYLDFRVTGELREKLLANYLDRTYVIFDPMEELRGFFIPGLGDGLILANGPDYGIALMKKKISSQSSRMVIPRDNHIAMDFLVQQGFPRGQRLPRMVLGPHPQWKPEQIYSRGTGYCG